MEFVVDMRNGNRKDMIEGCLRVFIRELKLEKSKTQLFVFSKKDFEKEQGCAGMVYPYAEGLITMDLDSRMSVEKLIEVVAHEMVHVKQIAKGQLKYVGKKMFWKGQRVYPKKMSYYDHPWEIEAWKMQRYLETRVWGLLEKAGIIDKVEHGLK
jgi:hypothetical protein